jgi:hypothetical protein
MEKQAYIWNLPTDRAAHARRLVEGGCRHVRVKAGGDGGRLWQAWSDPSATQPYRDAGLRVTPWFYTWPVQGDIDVVIAAMRAQPFDEYALNPEVEWRWQNSNENPWNSLQQANDGAAAWLAKMEAALPGVRRAFSSVPSWLDFPYEAWCAGCDQAEPQHYWPQWAAMAAVYNILPEIISLVHGDDGQWARSWVGPDGVPVTQILWGGKAKQVLGTNFADIGISVEGIPSGTFDRSLITGVFQPWTKRTA